MFVRNANQMVRNVIQLIPKHPATFFSLCNKINYEFDVVAKIRIKSRISFMQCC